MTETEIKEALKKVDAICAKPEAERTGVDRAILAAYLKKMDEIMLYGKSGKPRKPRFRWNSARFLRAQEIQRQVDMIRRAEWARLTEARRLRPRRSRAGG